MKSRLTKSIIAVLAVASFSLVGATPASAFVNTDHCPFKPGWVTITVSSTKATAQADTSCGGVQVRVKYNLNIGVTTYTAWRTGANVAVAYVPAGAGMVSADFKIGGVLIADVKP